MGGAADKETYRSLTVSRLIGAATVEGRPLKMRQEESVETEPVSEWNVALHKGTFKGEIITESYHGE